MHEINRVRRSEKEEREGRDEADTRSLVVIIIC